MHEFKLTWHGAVHGDIIIEAESASDAKTRLAEMRNNDLVKSSSIWQSEEPVSIDCVETDLGLMDIKEWELVYGS